MALYEVFKKLEKNEDNPIGSDISEPIQNNKKLIKDKCILVVDDNRVNLAVMQGMLEDLGFVNIRKAGNGREALEELAKSVDKNLPGENIDLVLMDCQMPVMNGYDATLAIRKGDGGEANKNIPIIAVTAGAFPSELQRCIDVGMNEYLIKPITGKELEIKMQQYLKEGMSPHSEVVSLAKEATYKYWDMAAALRYSGGSLDRLKGLIDIFLTDMPDKVKEAEKAFKTRDFESVQAISHEIKGAASSISARSLQQTAKEAMDACRVENLVVTGDKLSVMQEILDSLVIELMSFLGK